MCKSPQPLSLRTARRIVALCSSFVNPSSIGPRSFIDSPTLLASLSNKGTGCETWGGGGRSRRQARPHFVARQFAPTAGAGAFRSGYPKSRLTVGLLSSHDRVFFTFLSWQVARPRIGAKVATRLGSQRGTGLAVSSGDRRIVLRRLHFANSADRSGVGTKRRRSYEDEIERTRSDGLAFLRRIRQHAASSLSRLPTRSPRSSSPLLR